MASRRAALAKRAPDPRDQRLLAAWGELDENARFEIVRALKGTPHHLGYRIAESAPRELKTSLGYVVTNRFVTPLAAQMVEAMEWNNG